MNVLPVAPVGQHLGPPEAMFSVSSMSGTSAAAETPMVVEPAVLDVSGRRAHGSLGVLLDIAMGGSIIGHWPDGRWGVTTELAADFTRPLPEDGARLRALSHAIRVDESGAAAACTVVDGEGRTVAVGSTHVRWVRAPVPPPDEELLAEVRARPPRFLDFVREQERGVLDVAINENTGNPLGNLHGGVSLFMSEMAAQRAVNGDDHQDGDDHHDGDSPHLATTSIRMAYVSPCLAPGRATFRAQVVARRPALAVVRVEGADPLGVVYCHGTVVCQQTGPKVIAG